VSKQRTAPQALVGNAGDEEQVTKAATREKVTRKEQLTDLRQLLELPAFRRFAWRLLEECRVFRTPFDDDERFTLLRIGKGEVGRFLLDEISCARPAALADLMVQYAPAFAVAAPNEEKSDVVETSAQSE
jgi:hypothetical protein